MNEQEFTEENLGRIWQKLHSLDRDLQELSDRLAVLEEPEFDEN